MDVHPALTVPPAHSSAGLDRLPPLARASPSPPEPPVELKLKVSTQIKTPFPMPDVLVDSAGLPPLEGDEGLLALTVEEIKDMVSCTGLWVIVREGYGGLGKMRKGDG